MICDGSPVYDNLHVVDQVLAHVYLKNSSKYTV